MNKEMDIKDMVPVKTSERHVILDALRGFALLGIHRFSAFDVYLERRHLAVVCLIGHAAPSFPACFGQSVAGDFRSPIATSYSD